MYVEVMTIRFRAAMNRIVLRRGIDLPVLRVITLKSLHELDPHERREERILAVRLLTTSPARIAKDIDVGRPEGQALIAIALLATGELVMLRATFIADRRCDLTHQMRIERRRQTDRLRKRRRRARARNAMQRFVPPFVLRHAETRNRGGVILQLCDLLFERHPRDEIGSTLLERSIEILIGGLFGKRRCRES